MYVVKLRKIGSPLSSKTLPFETIDIYKYQNTFNRKEAGLRLKRVWYPTEPQAILTPILDTDQSELGSSHYSSSHPLIYRASSIRIVEKETQATT